MPLLTADSSIDPVSLKNVPDKFIIFYSSVVGGELWCPDCQDVQDLVKKTFDTPDSPSALIVYVGDRSQWKARSNIYRGDPWKIESIPTIIKLKNGKEEGRLVLQEIQDQLVSFALD
ncbi:hypothetical protein AMATHDRAFT_140416 [Amanita thiersii Skay4041]|uniref:Thioredoxin domain-containing protein n=1 Tax=Amanita thiersii Skay4041 TaxID=703135 RepID=A0A2A9NQ46_9AGAR|nr:hypothetical protein AMATHDRAFT_140416 [Amanita thiersii Skay4041]